MIIKVIRIQPLCTMNVHTELQGNPIVDISVWAEVVAQSTENKRTVEPAFPVQHSTAGK